MVSTEQPAQPRRLVRQSADELIARLPHRLQAAPPPGVRLGPS